MNGSPMNVELLKPPRRLTATFGTGLRPLVPSKIFEILSALTTLLAEKVKEKPLNMPPLPPLETEPAKLTAQAAPGPNALPNLTIVPPLVEWTIGSLTRGGATTMPLEGPLTRTSLLKRTLTPPFAQPTRPGIGASSMNPGGALLQGFLPGSLTPVYEQTIANSSTLHNRWNEPCTHPALTHAHPKHT